MANKTQKKQARAEKKAIQTAAQRLCRKIMAAIGERYQVGQSVYEIPGWIIEKVGGEPVEKCSRGLVFLHFDAIQNWFASAYPGFKKEPKPKFSPRAKPVVSPVGVRKAGTKASVEGFIRSSLIDPLSADFLTSFQWRALRMMALKKFGSVCMCCGATPRTGAVMNVDHIKPRITHPELALEIENLQILCSDCNAGKGNWDDTDWRPKAEVDTTKDFVITKVWISSNKTARGGYTKAQLEALGIEWPPGSGWIDRLEGASITQEAAQAFVKRSGKAEAAGQPMYTVI